MCYSLPRKGRLEGSGGVLGDWEEVIRTWTPIQSPATPTGFAGEGAARPNKRALCANGTSCCAPSRLEDPIVMPYRKGCRDEGRCLRGHAVGLAGARFAVWPRNVIVFGIGGPTWLADPPPMTTCTPSTTVAILCIGGVARRVRRLGRSLGSFQTACAIAHRAKAVLTVVGGCRGIGRG